MTANVAGGRPARLFQPGSPVPSNVIDLGLGDPNVGTLPIEALDIRHLTEDQRRAALSYGPPQGNRALIEALEATVIRDVAEQQETLITNGAMDAVILALQVLKTPNSVILAEEYTFPGVVMAARDLNMKIVPVKMRQDGPDLGDLQMQIETLRDTGRPIAALYLVPTGANPTGTCLSFDKRAAVARLVKKYGIILVEDDPYRDTYYEGIPPEPIANLAPEQVLHIRSLSKVLCPGVRLAIVTGPASVLEPMTALRAVGGTSPLASELLASFLRRVNYDTYLMQLRDSYRARRDLAVEHMSEHPSFTFKAPAAGFFLWVRVPQGTTGNELHVAALKRAVRILPGSAFAVDKTDSDFIRIAFSAASKGALAAGIEALAAITEKKG